MTRKLAVALILLLFCKMMPAQVQRHRGTAHTADIDISYETLGQQGSALPVIAINGGPGLTHAYMVQNDLWDRVSRTRLVVFYDQRGTGASKIVQAKLVPPLSQTMDAQVADLDAVREALKLDKIALVGDSYGGLVAMAYAAAHPEHVARMVLSDSPGPSWKSIVHLLPQVFPDIEEQNDQEMKKLGGAEADHEHADKQSEIARRSSQSDAAARAGLRNHFKMIFYSPEKRDAYMSRMGDLGYEPSVAEAVSKATADLDLSSRLAGFKFPTLVVSGRYDMNVAPLTAWRMAHDIPGAKVVFFEKSGHLPSYEEPERYLQVLEEFLSQ